MILAVGNLLRSVSMIFIIHSIFAACFVFLEQFAELWTSIGTANDPTDLTFSVVSGKVFDRISQQWRKLRFSMVSEVENPYFFIFVFITDFCCRLLIIASHFEQR